MSRQEISVSETDGTNPLTQTKQVNLRATASFQMLDRFPSEAGVSVEAIPVEFAQTSKRADDLFEILSFQAEEGVLRLRAVQVEKDAALSDVHECVRRLSGDGVLRDRQRQSRPAASRQPTRGPARFVSDPAPSASRVDSLEPSRPL